LRLLGDEIEGGLQDWIELFIYPKEPLILLMILRVIVILMYHLETFNGILEPLLYSYPDPSQQHCA
jgi:hypothetical protein